MSSAPCYDKIVVVDVEATCWQGERPSEMEQDIIEVGACLLNLTTGEIEDAGQQFVRPMRSTVSDFCTELTTITAQNVARAPLFTDTCHWLKEQYGTIGRAWASFGDFDRSLFAEHCAHYNVRSPFSRDHINIKPLFAIMHGKQRAVGTMKALQSLSLPFAGTQHRAMDDAVHVAQVLRSLLPCGRVEALTGKKG